MSVAAPPNEAPEPRWLIAAEVERLHVASGERFGGATGLRDRALLESALARPRHRYAYGDQPDLFSLAAEYAFGIARNHAFLDGNKRTALLAVRAFLFLNGQHFAPDEVETVTRMEGVADGSVDSETLARWIEASSEPLR